MSASPTAPRSPETDQIFDCVDDTTKEAKLSLDVSTTGLSLARSEYDLAIKAVEDAEGSTVGQQKAVADQELEITFHQTQMNFKLAQADDLQQKYNAAQAEVDICIAQPDSCTVAGKQIKLTAANAALQKTLDNGTEIESLRLKIEAGQTQLAGMASTLLTLQQGAAVSITAAKAELLGIEAAYINKRETQKRNQADYDELHQECMFQSFHTNQEQLKELRQDLESWGVLVSVDQTVAEDQDDSKLSGSQATNVTAGDKNPVVKIGEIDCRYKEISECQGRSLQLLTPETRKACKQMITPVCFEKTYETYWILDFFSVFFIPWAILGCSWEENFSYSLCTGSYAYIFLFNNFNFLGFDY